MLPEIAQLLILQDKDQHLLRFSNDLKRIPKEEERARAKLETDTQSVKAAKDRLMQNEVALKNIELQAQTRRDTIGKLKFQQFETRKNDEYQALGTEVVRYEKEVVGLEDQQLELMEKAEGLKAELAAAQKALAETQKLVDEELAQLAERGRQVASQIATFTEQRTKQAENVDAELMETYDRIIKHRLDSAVVTIENGICRGCFMKVAPAILVAAKGKKAITFCSNCGRIVYVDD